jgi:hypothetical protein
MAYDVPTADELQVRYTAFADVDDAVVTYWITDAQRFVTEAWTETDYAVALMAMAAHNMALAGLGTQAAVTSGIPAGVRRFKSGSFEAEFTEQHANAAASGDLSSTRYGQEYALLLRRNRGGPRVTPTGTVPYPYPFHYVDGEA